MMDSGLRTRLLWTINYHAYWSGAYAVKAWAFREGGHFSEARCYQDLSAYSNRLALDCRLRLMEG